MNRLITLAVCALALLFFIPEASAWGQLGHATVGQVAWNHLTPKAKKAILEYTGADLAQLASDADVYRSFWTLDLGFVPTNPDASRVSFLTEFDFTTPLNISPWSHSITVDENFKCFETDNLDGAYINNDAYYVSILSRKLREGAETMDPEARYRAIALITHFLGDMHCPMHIVYLPKNTVKGHIKVFYKGKETNLHSVWDGGIFSSYPWSYGDMAAAVDNASKAEIREITRGDVYDWASRSAEASWNVNDSVKEGDVLPSTYAKDVRPLLFSQLRDGGLRLAKVFNEIFK